MSENIMIEIVMSEMYRLNIKQIIMSVLYSTCV